MSLSFNVIVKKSVKDSLGIKTIPLIDCEGKTAEDIAIERKRIRAHNDDRSYEHCAEQTPSSPLYDTSSATDLTTIYTPRSPIRLGNSQSEEDASPSSSPSQKYYDPRYPDYASLI